MDCERTGGAEFPQSTRFTDGMTLSEPGHCVGPPARASRRGLWVVILALPLFGACASSEYVSLRKTPQNPLADQLQLFSRSGPKPSPRATQVLRRYGLADAASDDSRVVLAKLEKFYEHEPTAEASYALAELAYIGGVKAKPKDKTAALDFYGGAVAHAYKYLFDHSLAYQRNVYDPEFRGACNLYNSALEAMLRIVADKDGLRPGSKHQIHTGAHTCEVCVVGKGTTWRPEEIEKFEFVSDYEVQGLTNQYRNYGLGVPLIAIRRQPQTPIPSEKFYPPGLSVPATAFLRVLPRNATDGSLRAELELYDPLAVRDIDIAGVRVPLESDLSTPLAYFLNEPKVEDLSTLGFLSPEKYQNLRGIYMVQPYEPGKIPVLMVHGLWSSPITWMEMFNDLRSDPRIRERYQFWFYLYPTGQPFWISAAQLRKDLVEARQILDPEVRQPALDQLILVGHSMGGLVSVLQTLESGDDYWKAVSDKPLQEIDTDADTKARLANTFYFHTNPGVRRVITIGTPHRGSTFANEATRYLGRKLVSMPQMLVRSGQQLYRDNPGAFKNDSILHTPTSIDSLSPDCPILPIMLAAPRPPALKRHNIVGVIEGDGLLTRVSGKGDGVVGYDSAHLDNVDSEIVVNADHSHVHRHPIAVLEVRRILLENLAELNATPDPRLPRIYPASAPNRLPPGLAAPAAMPIGPAPPGLAPPSPTAMGPMLIAPQTSAQ